MNFKIVWILLFMIPLIALFDFVLFRKYTACEKCGYRLENMFHFLIPTVIEVLFFMCGIVVGMGLI